MNRHERAESAKKKSKKSKKSEPLSKQAYDLLKSLILNNTLQGGRYMLEDEVAELVDMSRTPFREALVQLQNDGLIEIIPRRGIRVLPLNVDDLREIYQVLENLESLAAEIITKSDRHEDFADELEAIVDEMEVALNRDDLDAWSVANEHFHRTVVNLAGMDRLKKFAHNLLDQSHRVRSFTLRLREKPVRSTANQRALVREIRAGNWRQAREIHKAHKLSWVEEMSELFKKFNITQL